MSLIVLCLYCIIVLEFLAKLRKKNKKGVLFSEKKKIIKKKIVILATNKFRKPKNKYYYPY